MKIVRFRTPHPIASMRHSYALIVANWYERIWLRRGMARHPGLFPADSQPFAKALGATFVLRAKPVSTLRRNHDFVQSSWLDGDEEMQVIASMPQPLRPLTPPLSAPTRTPQTRRQPTPSP